MARSRPLSLFVARPRLTAAIGLGAATAILARLAFARLEAPALFALGWDVACLAYIGLLLPRLLDSRPEVIRLSAARDDEGRGLILGLMTFACAVSLVAVANELNLAKTDDGAARAIHVGFAVATVAISWAMMQLIFAVHYAHEYYGADGKGGDARGLKFPDDEAPDYWDFVHFSVVIGVAAQTADVAFTAKALRRVGTMHSLAAFIFNTLIVALTINLAAGLF